MVTPKRPRRPPLPSSKNKTGVFAEFTDTDAGWNRVVDRVAQIERVEIEAGYFGDEAAHTRVDSGDRKSVLARAAINQFGAPSDNIPARPFLTAGFDAERAVIEAAIDEAFKGTDGDALAFTAAFRDAGKALTDGIARAVSEWDTPPNAEYTILLKGFDDPLVETGKMGQSAIARYNLVENPKGPQIFEVPAPKLAQVRQKRAGGVRTKSGALRALFAALNAEGKATLALRAPKKSTSKKATATRFTARTRFRPLGTAKRPGQKTR